MENCLRVGYVFAIAMFLNGCVVYSQMEHLWEPTPMGFSRGREVPPLYSTGCRFSGERIVVPLSESVLLRLEGIYTNKSGGTVLRATLYVPTGVTLRFSEVSFIRQGVAGTPRRTTISDITRRVYYGPKRGSGVSTKTLVVPSNIVLKGWTAEEAINRAELPVGSVVDGELHNTFDFEVSWEGDGSEEFVLTLQDVDVDGHRLEDRSISYKYVEKRVHYNSLCS